MTNVPVTDADREALWLRLLDSCKGGPQWEYARACEDADAQAIARARAEERDACVDVCRWFMRDQDAPPAWSSELYDACELKEDAYDAGVASGVWQRGAAIMAAIRARGEKGED